MLKNLFDFKVSKTMRVAKIVLLVALIAAIVIAAIGIVQAVDVAGMKELLGMAKNQRLIAKDVMFYLLKNYLIWSVLILAVGGGVYYTLKVKDRKAQ